MKRITAILLISIADMIILLHAVVPHHHHDCHELSGFVFENELDCSCDSHHHNCCDYDCKNCQHKHSHHPFGSCKLQDLLSHLVLDTKDPKTLFVISQIPIFNLYISGFQQFEIKNTTIFRTITYQLFYNEDFISVKLCGNIGFRAPPLDIRFA